MKFGKTWRKLVCFECGKHIGWMKDIVSEKDYNGMILNEIYCEACKNTKM